MSQFLCQARQYGDEMQCGRCKFLWDMDNKNPPRCLTAAEFRNDPLKPIINEMAARSYGSRKA